MHIYYENIYKGGGTLSVVIEHNDDKVEFKVATIIRRVNKKTLENPGQFKLLVDYLDYKGLTDQVFNTYKEIENLIPFMALNGQEEIINAMSRLLSFIDPKQVADWMEETKPFIIPNRIKDEFDYQLEKDGKITRVRTYIRRDYQELVGLVLAAKIIIGPIGEYSAVAGDAIPIVSREYIMISRIPNTNHLFESEAAHKVVAMMLAQVEDTSQLDKVLPKARISRDEVGNYILFQTFLMRYPIALPQEDTDKTNVITMSYTFADSLLSQSGAISQRWTFKTGGNGDEEESESSLEIYRATTTMSIGDIEEFNAFAHNHGAILNVLGLKGKKYVHEVDNIRGVIEDVYLKTPIPKRSVVILSNVLHKTMDARAIMYYLRIDAMINLMATAFVYLWHRGHKDIANLLLTIDVLTDEINVNANSRDNVNKELQLALDEKYDMRRVTRNRKRGQDAVVSPMSKHIVEMVRLLNIAPMRYVAPDEYMEGRSRKTVIPADIKNKLIELYIDL